MSQDEDATAGAAERDEADDLFADYSPKPAGEVTTGDLEKGLERMMEEMEVQEPTLPVPSGEVATAVLEKELGQMMEEPELRTPSKEAAAPAEGDSARQSLGAGSFGEEFDLERAMEMSPTATQEPNLEMELERMMDEMGSPEPVLRTPAKEVSQKPSSPRSAPKEGAAVASPVPAEPRATEADTAASPPPKPPSAEDGDDLESLDAEDLDLERELEREMEAALGRLPPNADEEEQDLEVELERMMDEMGTEEPDLRTPSRQARRRPPSEQVSPPKPSPPKEAAKPSAPKEPKDRDSDETRYTEDHEGNKVYKWKVDYAARAGGGRAMCRDANCLERCDQAGVAVIEKGALRIGRRVLPKDGEMMTLWYHARCIFNTFSRARKSTRIIESPEDLEGFDALRSEDQELLRRIISGSEDLRNARFMTAGPNVTGKRGLGHPGGDGPDPKRRRELEENEAIVSLRKGDRVWTKCWVRKTEEGPDGAVDVASKSKKPELGMIVEETEDGKTFLIQFESKEHEMERLEMMEKKRYRRIRAWLRYPRLFEGKSQKIERDWIQLKRAPPKLCSCKKQEWGHSCPCGITCSRVARPNVWGVDQ